MEPAYSTAIAGSASRPPKRSSDSPAYSGVTGVRKSSDHGRRTWWSKSWTYAKRYSSRSRPVVSGQRDRADRVGDEAEREQYERTAPARRERLESREGGRELLGSLGHEGRVRHGR